MLNSLLDLRFYTLNTVIRVASLIFNFAEDLLETFGGQKVNNDTNVPRSAIKRHFRVTKFSFQLTQNLQIQSKFKLFNCR